MGNAQTGPVATQNATPELPGVDRRVRLATPAGSQRDAATTLKQRVPDAQVDYDGVTSSPAWVRSVHGFLTGPNGSGRAISSAALARFDAADSNRITRAFLDEHRALFGHGSEILNNARVKTDLVAPSSGLHTTVWEQRVDGIPVFEGLLTSHITKRGELVSLSSHFVPNAEQAAGVPGRRAIPAVTARDAVAGAARDIGENLAATNITPSATPQGAEQRQVFTASNLKGDVNAQLVWFPVDGATLRLSWQVIMMSRARDEMFNHVIDAQTGEVLLRRSLTEHLTNATYRVFTTPSPAPFTLGYPSNLAGAFTVSGESTADTNQPPQVARVLVVTNAFDTNASPNGWINDSDNSTSGNNVNAYLDAYGDERADIPPPVGSPFHVFDFALDLTQDPMTYTNPSVVNLFYWNNWMHDRLYEFGFTEAAGNFQSNNFGRGGASNDPVLAEAQDGYYLNNPHYLDNASFSTPPDGSSPRMEMFVFNGPTPGRDADFDTEVILHEYTHGLSNRRVGGGVGISALQSRGLGEGWSDFYSLAMLTQPADDPNGCYPEGPYVSYQLFGPGYNFNQNYYFGVRRYPYSTDMTKDPGTLKDIDPGQADPHFGVPMNPVIANTANEIHNQGEIWCAALWDARANLIAKYGFTNGNRLILQLVTDGMTLTPANPTFVQARDAILQADLVDNGAMNQHELWLAFAKRGIGMSATCPVSTTTAGVSEAYDVPDLLLIVPATTFSASGPVGGPFTPASQGYTLYNTGTNSLSWSVSATAPWVSFSASNGVLAPSGGFTNVVLSLNSAASNLPVGEYVGETLAFSDDSDAVTQYLGLNLFVSLPHIYNFSFNSDPGWARQGEWAFGPPLGQGGSVHGNPDPAMAATGSNVFGVNLAGDYSTNVGGPYYLQTGPLNFSGCSNVELQFQRWLNSDFAPYVYATVEASADGTNWTPVFTNFAGPITDNAWTNVQYDLSSVADGQPAVYVRWGYQVSPSAFAYSGWNIDDVQFLGSSQLSVTAPASASENSGVLAGQGHVSVPHPAPASLTVHLASSNPARLSVPPTVTIPSGQTNATFDLTLLDDHVLNGTQPETITASVPGDLDGTTTIYVSDAESAVLSVSAPTNVTEGDGVISGSIGVSAPPTEDVTVLLASSDPTSLYVPPSVVISAGQTNTAFFPEVIDDNRINGTRLVTINAHVINWTDGNLGVFVHDNESTNLTLTLLAQARESNGLLSNAGTVRISGVLTSNLTVTLASSNTAKLLVPPSVTILAGQTAVAFNVTTVSGNSPETTLPITVAASAAGFGGASAVITIFDNQTPPVPFNPHPPNLSTTNPATSRLSWSAGIGEGVERLLNGGFETGDLSNWLVPPTNASFVIDNGTVLPPSGDAATPPFAGQFSAFADAQWPAISCVVQSVAVPVNQGAATLSWVNRVRNFHTTFTSNQQFRVEIRDTNNNVLSIPYVTQPGDPLLDPGWTTNSADVTAFAGQTIRVAFVVNAGLDYLDVHLDQVSLRTSTLPPAMFDVYYGTNPAPSLPEFQGTTTNTFWNLAQPASPFTNHYWQVVAHRTNFTAGPVWMFSTLPSFSISPVTIVSSSPGYTNAVFNVTLSQPDVFTATVNFATADGSAVAPTNYLATNGTLTFAAGVTNQTVIVPVAANTNSSSNLAFLVNLANPVNSAISVAQATGTIVNPNTPPMITMIQIASGQVTLVWTSIPSKTYRVQYKANLTDSWSDLSGDVTAGDFTASKTDSTGLTTRRFYHVLVLP